MSSSTDAMINWFFEFMESICWSINLGVICGSGLFYTFFLKRCWLFDWIAGELLSPITLGCFQRSLMRHWWGAISNFWQNFHKFNLLLLTILNYLWFILGSLDSDEFFVFSALIFVSSSSSSLLIAGTTIFFLVMYGLTRFIRTFTIKLISSWGHSSTFVSLNFYKFTLKT